MLVLSVFCKFAGFGGVILAKIKNTNEVQNTYLFSGKKRYPIQYCNYARHFCIAIHHKHTFVFCVSGFLYVQKYDGDKIADCTVLYTYKKNNLHKK